MCIKELKNYEFDSRLKYPNNIFQFFPSSKVGCELFHIKLVPTYFFKPLQ